MPKLWQITNATPPHMAIDPYRAGRIARPLVRGNEMFFLEPNGNQEAGETLTPAVVSVRDLKTGEVIRRFQTPINRTGIQRTNAGMADCDYLGVWWDIAPGNTILAACGGDRPGRWSFDADTGFAKAITGLGVTSIGSGANTAACFTSAADVPFIVSGGNNNHSHISANGAIHDLRGAGRSIPFSGFKHFVTGLIHSGTQAAYRLDDLARTNATAAGFRLWGIQAVNGGVGCEVPGWLPYNAWGHNGQAKPKPAVMLPDGRIAVLCSKAVAGSFDGKPASVNDYSETRIAIIHPTPNGKTGMIAGFTSWKSLNYTLSDPIPFTDNGQCNPQLLVAGDSLVVFFPPTSSKAGYMAAIDTAGKMLWQSPVSSLARFYEPYRSDNFSRYGNLTAVVHGGEICLLEFINGTNLFTVRYSLAGKMFGITEQAVETTPADTSYSTIHHAESTPSGLLVSLLSRVGGLTRQTVVMLTNESMPPVVVPVVPTPEQEVLDFAKPRLSAEKYQAIERILNP